MRRFLFFISLSFSLLWAQTGFTAESVPLRISEKEGYARIVFKWNKDVDYTLSRDAGNLSVTFDESAEIEKQGEAQNVGAHTLVSTAPLTVGFVIPKSSKVRDFKIGKRIIFDVYNPENPADRLKKDVETVKTVEKKKEAPKEASKEIPPAIPPAIVLVPERLDKSKLKAKKEQEQKKEKEKADKQAQKDHKQKALKQAVKQENHVISMRATRGFGVASFVMHGDIWIVMDDDASLVTPNLSSPSPEVFGEMQRVAVDGARGYKMALPKGHDFLLKTQGGGLSWDIIMGDEIKEKITPEPVVKGDGAIVFPLYGASKVLRAQNPKTGQSLIIVTVSEARHFGAQKQSYVEFEMFHSLIGLAIFSKVDDLNVSLTSQGVKISRPHGLSLASAADRRAAEIFKTQAKQAGHGEHEGHSVSSKEDRNLYKFRKWMVGPVEDLTKNQNILLASMPDKSETRKVEDLIALGKMMLSHGLPQESLGYFEFAKEELPGLEDSAEFKALRGAALALSWKSEDALRDLLHKSLQGEDEVKYWTSFALADLGDWQQAAAILPKDYKAIYDYPASIAHPLALMLAEVNLRAGQIQQAQELLALIESDNEKITVSDEAALQYLKGEAARQKGDIEQTKTLWQELSKGDDDLYRVKAGLALTILEKNDKKIGVEEVVDRLESLRYAWRGDDLEAQVKYWLGKAYFDKKDFIVGLSIMRDAASIAGQTALAKRIAYDMAQTYIDLYLGDDLKNVPALEAVAVYEQFSELTPVGEKGNKLEQNLAEHLVRNSLLKRASDILSHQVNHRLQGEEKMNVAVRLASIELMNGNPQKAVDALAKASEIIRTLKDSPSVLEKKREIEFLRIRAYAQNEEYDKALALLDALPADSVVNRFKADIAWKAQYWKEAAKFLNAVIIDENITPDTALSQQQAALILNRAIALSLNDEHIALANMRAKYTDLMKKTGKANQFEIITRPRRVGVITDREALLSAVEEVELFKDFMEAYSKGN